MDKEYVNWTYEVEFWQNIFSDKTHFIVVVSNFI